MKVERKTCIVCNSSDTSLELSLLDYSISKEAFDIYGCSKCGFSYTQNAPSEESIGKYYQSENYISHSDTTKGLVNKIYHLIRKIMISKKYRLIKRLSKGNKILDVGCGTGYFLKYMKGKQFETKGIEVDNNAREHGISKFKLDILPPTELINGNINMKFDVITLWHVFEHIYGPREYLTIIKKLMNDDSHLIIAVPNYKSYDARHYSSFWAGYDVPRHLWHFSPETIQILAKSMNFEITKMKRMPFDSFYTSILSEQYQNNFLGFIRGSIIGLISYLVSIFDKTKSSSVIYVMKKTSVEKSTGAPS